MLKTRVLSSLLIILFILVCLYCASGASNIELQCSPQAPKVPANQQPESALQGEQKTEQPQKTTDYPSTVAPTNQSHELKTTSNKDFPKSTNEGTEFYVFYGYRFRITDSLLVLFTFALFVCTAFLAWIAYRQQKAMILSQRAFVFCPKFIVHAAKDPKKLMIIPVWENSGTTQAKDVVCHVSWQGFPSTGIPDDFDYPDFGNKQHFPFFIGPKSVIIGAECGIDNQFVNQVLEGHHRYYIWGWAEYNDVFYNMVRHRTEFCREIVLSPIDGGLHPELRIYGPHNGADKQCMKKPTT